jgi:hypothetical protein
MKRMIKTPAIILIAGYFFLRFAEAVIQPLKDMPVPNFNNQYDSTML